MRIAIIGSGYVGLATKALLGKDAGHEISMYDKPVPYKALAGCKAVFICVPTPTRRGAKCRGTRGQCDTRIVDNVIKNARQFCNAWIVIRSTVELGYTKSANKKYGRVVFQPEFFREASFLEDVKLRKWEVVGSDNRGREAADFKLLLEGLYRKKQVYFVNSGEAELMKYAVNSYLGTKVIWANEMKGVCDKWSLKWDNVRKLITLDARIEDDHLQVTNEGGFGGKCLPKDIKALIFSGILKNADMSLLKAVDRKNRTLRTAPEK